VSIDLPSTHYPNLGHLTETLRLKEYNKGTYCTSHQCLGSDVYIKSQYITSQYCHPTLSAVIQDLKQKHLCNYRSFFSAGSFLQRLTISALQASSIAAVDVPVIDTSSTTDAHVLRQNARNGEIRILLLWSPCRSSHRFIWHKFLFSVWNWWQKL